MIDRLFDALRPFFAVTHTHSRRVIAVCVVLLLGGGWGALQLRINSDLSTLIPESYPSVQALNEMRERLGGESEMAVLVESPSFDANRRFAEALIPKALARSRRAADEPYFTYVDYRRDVDFLKANALYFATDAELDSLTRYLRDEIRDARLEANPFYFELEDAEGTSDETVESLQALYDDLVTSEYPVSDDSTLLVVRLYPSGAQTNLDFIESAYRDVERLVASMEPTRYHPEMQVTLGGRLLRSLVEVRAITDDVVSSFGSGVATLLLLVMAYFFYKSYRVKAHGDGVAWRVVRTELARSPVTALLLGGPLLASLAWTFGVVFFAYGELNVMTSTLGLVLFGLGIDFGIHFYARYVEERGAGRSVADALDRAFMTTGRAIAAVAITTAAGFYVLLIADFRGFSQFGFTAGTGTLFALLAMLVLLPALLAFGEQTGLLHLDAAAPSDASSGTSANPDDGSPPWMHRWAGWILLGSLAALAVAMVELPNVRFQYDFGELQPRYEAYQAVKQKTDAVYNTTASRNAAYVLTDTPADAEAVAEVLRTRAARDTTSPTIRAVETIHDRFPMDPATQQRKLARIDTVRTLLDDAFLRASDDVNLRRLREAASTRAPLTVAQIPDFLKNPFLTKQGTLGNVVIIYPSVGLSDGTNSMAFADDVARIELPGGRVYHAGSTSIVASDMLRLMIDEAPWMVALTIFWIVTLKWIVLRDIRWVAAALLPLAAAFVWMFGGMVVFGWSLNFYNLVVLPTVLGIGDDSGIHVVHRYLEEGRGSIRRVLTSTGEHVAVSAVTTMVGFGGLMLSMHPGLRSIGELAVLGISLTLVAALVTLPAVLVWLERHTTWTSDEETDTGNRGLDTEPSRVEAPVR